MDTTRQATAGPAGPFRKALSAVAVLGIASAVFAGADAPDEPQAIDAPESIDRVDVPAFLQDGFYPANSGSVHRVHSAATADLVLVRGGFDAGFRNGIVCVVRDDEEPVGEIMLVDVRKNCAAGLILQLEAGSVVEPGHEVRIKTVR